MGKYIIILEANPMGYAIDTTLMATNRLANDLIDAGQAREIDEPMRPSKSEEQPIMPHINVTVPDSKVKRKAGRPPRSTVKF